MSDTPFRFRSRDGVELIGRAIDASDRALLAEHFEHLGPESRYRRFLTPKRSLTEAELTRLTVVDHHDDEALIALDPQGELVAVARYFVLATDRSKAEVAIAVADEWQHRGVGWVMLSQLMRRARAEGIRAFVASCLVDNRDMITLFRELGESVAVTGQGAGVLELEITLGALGTAIVAAWDGREGGFDALVLARLLACAVGGEVGVVHVETGQPTDRDPRKDLEDAFGASGRVPELDRVESKSPESALRAIAAQQGVEALVVGSTHQAGFGKVHPGAVSERLLGSVPCPLVIAPLGFGAQPRDFDDGAWLRVIEAGFDGSEGSQGALAVAARIAAAATATVRVVAVEQPLPHDQIGAPVTAAMAETQHDLRARLEEEVRSLPPNLRALPLFERSSDPAAVITGRSEEGVDLLVIGSRAHGRVGTLLGSTARQIVRRAGCPVLVAPAT